MEDLMYAQIALKHSDFKPKPLSIDKRQGISMVLGSSVASSSPIGRKHALLDENDEDTTSMMEQKNKQFDEISSTSMDQEELQKKKQMIQMRKLQETQRIDARNLQTIQNGTEGEEADEMEVDFSQEDEFGGNLTAFTRKNGTIVFTKNGVNFKKKRMRKQESKMSDSDVVVNLYKDLDLDNFKDEEELASSEFVLTLKKTKEGQYQLLHPQEDPNDEQISPSLKLQPKKVVTHLQETDVFNSKKSKQKELSLGFDEGSNVEDTNKKMGNLGFHSQDTQKLMKQPAKANGDHEYIQDMRIGLEVKEEQSLMKDGVHNPIDLVEIQSIQSIQSSDYSFEGRKEINWKVSEKILKNT